MTVGLKTISTLLCGLAACVALDARAQTLVVGRADVNSIIADVASAVMLEVAARAGLALQYERLPVVRAMEEANGGQIDAILLASEDTSRPYENLIRLATPIVRMDIAVYGMRPDLPDRTRSEVRQMHAGIVGGNLALRRSAAGMQVTYGSMDGGALEMLRSGRFDVAIMSYSYAEMERKRMQDVVLWPHCWASEPLYFGLNKKWAALVPRLQKALLQMQKEHVMDRYYAQALREHAIKPLDCAAEAFPR